ncbi:MAG TPA: hypothetical protein VNF29_02975 [Candidatus Binataceae bacterium]|nr:hypothetical protein [Candidatus Binataceae bacterium]
MPWFDPGIGARLFLIDQRASQFAAFLRAVFGTESVAAAGIGCFAGLHFASDTVIASQKLLEPAGASQSWPLPVRLDTASVACIVSGPAKKPSAAVNNNVVPSELLHRAAIAR